MPLIGIQSLKKIYDIHDIKHLSQSQRFYKFAFSNFNTKCQRLIQNLLLVALYNVQVWNRNSNKTINHSYAQSCILCINLVKIIPLCSYKFNVNVV